MFEQVTTPSNASITPRAPWPALTRAMSYRGPERRSGAALMARLMALALDEIDYGMLMIGEDGHVMHVNHAARMELEAKLMGERQRSQKEFAMLLKAFDADPAMLRQFVQRAERGLLEVNDLLRSTSSAQGEAAILKAVNEACRRVHALKGDAATLGLDTLAAQREAGKKFTDAEVGQHIDALFAKNATFRGWFSDS